MSDEQPQGEPTGLSRRVVIFALKVLAWVLGLLGGAIALYIVLALCAAISAQMAGF